MFKSSEVVEKVNSLTTEAPKSTTVKEVQDAYKEIGEDLADCLEIEASIRQEVADVHGTESMVNLLNLREKYLSEMEDNIGQKITVPDAEDVLDRVQAYVIDDPDDLTLKEMQFALRKLGEDYMMHLCMQQCMKQALFETFSMEQVDCLLKRVVEKGANDPQPQLLSQMELMSKASDIVDARVDEIDLEEAKRTYFEIADSLLYYMEIQECILDSVRQAYGQEACESILKRAEELKEEKKAPAPELTQEEIEACRKVFGAVIDEDMLYNGEREE